MIKIPLFSVKSVDYPHFWRNIIETTSWNIFNL